MSNWVFRRQPDPVQRLPNTLLNTGNLAASLYIFPASDVSTNGWTASSGTDLSAMINEMSYDDATYIISPPVDGSQGSYDFALTSSLAAGAWQIPYRAKQLYGTIQIKFTLMNSSNVAQGNSGWVSLTGSFASATFYITTTGTSTRGRIEVQ